MSNICWGTGRPQLKQNEVLARIHERLATGSKPGQRDDPYRIVLSIEGGANRALYASGMALELNELGLLPCFDEGSPLLSGFGLLLISAARRFKAGGLCPVACRAGR